MWGLAVALGRWIICRPTLRYDRYDRTEDDQVKPLGFAGSDMSEVDIADVRKACATMAGRRVRSWYIVACLRLLI
jgi:hypothetical protein